jgi:hypothetical protein
MENLAGLGSMPPPSNGVETPVQTLVWGIVYCSVIILVSGIQILQARKANRFRGKVKSLPDLLRFDECPANRVAFREKAMAQLQLATHNAVVVLHLTHKLLGFVEPRDKPKSPYICTQRAERFFYCNEDAHG